MKPRVSRLPVYVVWVPYGRKVSQGDQRWLLRSTPSLDTSAIMGHAAILDSVAQDRSKAYEKQRHKDDKTKERLDKLYKLEKGRKEARKEQGESGRRHVHHRSLSPPARYDADSVKEAAPYTVAADSESFASLSCGAP